MKDIKPQIRNLFNWINKPHVQQKYIQDNNKWNGLCASLNLIKDMENAIEEFDINDYGMLNTIGLFQSIFIQQDALKELYKTLLSENLNYKNHPNLYEIREIRNDAFGHPSNRGGGRSRHLVNIRRRGKPKEIAIMNWKTENDDEITKIDLEDFIKKQKKGISKLLEDAIDKFENLEKSMRKNLKIKRLSPILNITYRFEKLYAAIKDESHREWGDFYIEELLDVLIQVREGLEERYDALKNTPNNVEHEIQKMNFTAKRLLQKVSNSEFDMEYEIYLNLFEYQFDSLRGYLEEIDETIPVEY